MNIFPGLFHKKLGLSRSKLHSINFLQRNINNCDRVELASVPCDKISHVKRYQDRLDQLPIPLCRSSCLVSTQLNPKAPSQCPYTNKIKGSKMALVHVVPLSWLLNLHKHEFDLDIHVFLVDQGEALVSSYQVFK